MISLLSIARIKLAIKIKSVGDICECIYCDCCVFIDILGNIFGLTKREMMDIKFDEVFDTHLRNQDKAYGDNLDVLCFIKCLVSPFREPSNFFYWFALCDTNCSGGLDNLEFQRLIGESRTIASKEKGSNQCVNAIENYRMKLTLDVGTIR